MYSPKVGERSAIDEFLQSLRATIASRSPSSLTTFWVAQWPTVHRHRQTGASAQGGSGWAGGNLTRIPRPVTSWSATAIAWTGRLLGSPHPYPTMCRLWVACSSVGSRVARRLPGRPLRCWSGLSVGRRGSGRPPPWCPQGGLLPQGTCWTLWQIGGDCNAIAGALATGACLSSPVPGPRGSRGRTCRTLPRAGSVSASRIG